jgi:hypothetical protein
MMDEWKVPKMWEGGECWIIGGGPSMPREFGVPEDVIEQVYNDELPLSSYSPYLSPIHNKHVIGVNAAFLLGEWVDVMYFGDGRFYTSNIEAMNKRTKIKVSSNPNLVKRSRIFQGVKYVPRDLSHPEGISSKGNKISWNLNSGAAAIGLAYLLGVKRIYLLGFDMSLGENGRQWWHSHYSRKNPQRKKNPKRLPFDRHLKSFPMVSKDAERLGLEIINVSPNSEIKEFKRVKLSDVL